MRDPRQHASQHTVHHFTLRALGDLPMSFSLQTRLFATTAVCALCAGNAFAQSVTPPANTTILSPIVVDTPKAPSPAAPRKRAPAATPSAPPAAQPGALDALSTSSEKVNASIFDSPGTVTVKSTAEMERQNINTPRDLVRDEPGVSFGNQPTRGGGTNYVIRGIGENRVRVEIDGVKVPDFPGSNAGSPTGYTRDFVDLDALKRVEIIRGPASALYGSDAIGGVIAYVTKDPADYLALVNKDWYFSTKGGFDTVDRSVYTTITGANRVGNVDSMLLVTRRWGHEVIPNGSMSPNPQNYMATNTLGKVVYNALDGGQLKLTGEYFNKSAEIDVRSEVGVFPTTTFARIFNSTADDTNERSRLSLEWNSPVRWWIADSIRTNVYATKGMRQELSDVFRANYFGGPVPTTPTQRRLSDFGFEQTIYGGEIQMTAKRHAFGAENLLTYGVTLDQTSTSRPRYRTQTTLSNGAVTSTVGGETFPNKNFPDTETTQVAAYVQNIARWGALRVIPAVRFDLYDLKVNPDAMFNNSNTTGVVVSDMTATAISPKLGITYDLTDQYRVFGQYVHGFRAPPYDNANFGFRNTTSFYEILPSANLRPETVDGYEGGLRGRFANGSSFQVSGFYNKYKDFIDTVTLASPPPPAFTQFQYQNVSNVTIYGWEAKGEWRFVPTWSLFGSLAYAHGTNDDTKAPLNSVDPLKVVSGLRYRGTNGWNGEVRATWVAEKDQVTTGTFVVPAHTTVDTLFGYEVSPGMTINAGVFNVFNASYFNPTDVAGIAANSSLLELYRAPGRSAAMNVTFRW